MGSCITAGACCCVGCCCQQCADGLTKWLGMERVTKIFYLILVIVFTVPAIFVFFFLNKWSDFTQYFDDMINCPTTNDLGCIGQSVVFRLSLALLILFALMFLFMLLRSRLSMAINEGCFLFKYLLIVGLVIGFLWVHDEIFNNFAQFSKYASIVYMVVQSIILIDLAYLSGIHLVKKYDQGQTQYSLVLIISSLIIEAGAIALNVIGYINFRNEWYGHTLWVNIVTTILLVIMPIVQLLHFNPQGSLLGTAWVSLLVSYLTFIAQFSYGNGGVRMNLGALIADIACSTVLFAITMCGSIMGGTGQVRLTENTNINQAMGVAQTETNLDAKYQAKAAPPVQELDSEEKNVLKYTESWGWVKWHLYMCLASIYLSMLITNWISINVTTGEIKSSPFGFWVRVGVAWATFLLYIWTLVVPRVCRQRDFTVE